jgi:hypothetical protein
MLQLLHREPGKGSKSFDQKGILIISTFFHHSLLIHKLPCRVPQDIPLASPTKNISPESESPKVDKPPSPSTGKTIPETMNLLGSEDINVPVGASSNLASPPASDSSQDATHQHPRPDPAIHQDASPISLKLFRLRSMV